jgi:general secretion pathway protein E
MSVAGTAMKTGHGAVPESAEALLRTDICGAFAGRFGIRLIGEQDGRLLLSLCAGADPGGLLQVVRFLAPPVDVSFERTDDASTASLLDSIIAEAAHRNVAQIHFEPYNGGLVIRMRSNGALREMLRIPAAAGQLIVSRIKAIAGLDRIEPQVTQEGRILTRSGGSLPDLGVSILPCIAGERIVLRILDPDDGGSDLSAPGMPPAVNMLYRAALAEPGGLVILAGPTGSGKTTSLYAGLRQLNDGSRNILTVEDPVHQATAGVGQVEVDAPAGLTCATALRAILRQDPDVVMVGEIGNSETAEIAVQASATGHLVLATIHAEDAVGAITRLRDMKIEPFLLASTLRAVIAQRLVRRLCPACRVAVQTSASESALLGFETGTTIYQARGCQKCSNSGYKGRIGVFEAIGVDDTIRRLINSGGDEAVIASHVFRQSQNIGSSARSLVLEGVTTTEEAVRISRRESEDA